VDLSAGSRVFAQLAPYQEVMHEGINKGYIIAKQTHP
jgi:hypothetical protein